MNDLLRSPLGPALVLLFASALLRVVASPRRAAALALLTLAPLGASFVLLMDLRSSGVAVQELAWWPLVTPPLRVLWALDGWNWLALALLLLVGGSAVLLTWQSPGKRSGAYHGMSFALLGAAALTLVSDNLLALSGAWVATDILLVARARGSRAQGNTAPVWLEVAGSLLLLMAIGITSINVASTTLATARLPVEAMALLLVVAALRMAAYPLHLWLAPSGSGRDRGTQLLINGLGLVTGGWLLGRVLILGAGAWFSNPLWPPLLVFLTLAAGLAAWSGRERDRLAMLSSSRATWLWVVVALAPTAVVRDALGWAMAGVVLGLALLAVGQAINEQWRWRVPVALAAITLAGLPLTAGMPARALAQPPHLALLLLLVVADGLAVATVLASWRTVPLPTPAHPAPATSRPAGQLWGIDISWPVVRLLTAVGLVAVPNVLWGLQPARLAVLAGFNSVLSLGDLLRQLGLWQLLAIVAALALGAGFYQLAQQPASLFKQWQQRLAAAAGLRWILAGLGWLLQWIELGWRNALLVVEGEGYLGWVVLVLLLAVLAVQL
jgi:formate hydrogenlyase subunit 3/multisubunit Na+/H+ antiporter MnhD subunit